MSKFLVPLVLLCAISLAVLSIANDVPQMRGIVNPVAIQDWETSGTVKYVSGQNERAMSLIVTEKKSTIWLGNNALIKQKVKVESGKLYGVTFSATKTCNQNVTINVYVSQNSKIYDTGLFAIQNIYSNDRWASYSWGFVGRFGVIEISMQSLMVRDAEGTFCGPIIDAVFYYYLVPSPGNMIKNGNFEEGPYIIENTPWGVLIPPTIEVTNSPLPGWKIESHKAARYIDSQHFFVPEGERAIELVGGDESVISQVVATRPGRNYYLSFAMGDANDNCVGDMIVEANVGILNDRSWYESKGKGGFRIVKLLFQAVSTITRVSFMSVNYITKNDTSGSVCGPVIDSVTMVAA